MSAILKDPRLYDRLLALPENTVGEIIEAKALSSEPAVPFFFCVKGNLQPSQS